MYSVRGVDWNWFVSLGDVLTVYVYFSCVPCKGSHQVLLRQRAATQCKWLIFLRNHLWNRCFQSAYNIYNCCLAVVPTRRLKVSVILHICLGKWHLVLVVVISVIFKLRAETVIGNPLRIRRGIRLAKKALNMAGFCSRNNNSNHVVTHFRTKTGKCSRLRKKK